MFFPQEHFHAGDDGVVVEERITDSSVSGPWCSLPCRSIRIGNYKVRLVKSQPSQATSQALEGLKNELSQTLANSL